MDDRGGIAPADAKWLKAHAGVARPPTLLPNGHSLAMANPSIGHAAARLSTPPLQGTCLHHVNLARSCNAPPHLRHEAARSVSGGQGGL